MGGGGVKEMRERESRLFKATERLYYDDDEEEAEEKRVISINRCVEAQHHGRCMGRTGAFGKRHGS